MNLSNITIKNFRGFKYNFYNFDPQMNVILGDNTTGKTTLLHAVQIALGAFLQEMTFLPGGNGYVRNFKPTDQVKTYSESNKTFIPIPEKPSIQVNAEGISGKYDIQSGVLNMSSLPVLWKRTSNKNSKANAIQLMDFVEEMESIRRDADKVGINSIFPLFLSFGASRLEKNYRSTEKTKQRETREAKAYKCALDEQVDFKSAFDWIYRYDKNLSRGQEFPDTDKAFINAIRKAIPAVKQIAIDTKNSEFTAQVMMAKDEHPYWLTYDMMSAGFKAMINIVAEIAHRCIELNGFLGADAVEKTPGIVMIDEVDLYLHPHWQQHVLADLQDAFPMMQFIVTTHSPFIVQSVDSRNIISLDSNVMPISPSNRGIEEIAAAEMGMQDQQRSEKYIKKFNLASEYFQLVKEGMAGKAETEQVKAKLDELEIEAGLLNDPAYEAYLRLYRGTI